MPVDQKAVSRYIRVRALVSSPNANEAASARAKVEAMENAHPGIREAADAALQNARTKAPEPQAAPDFFSFLDKLYSAAQTVTEAAAAAVQGKLEAARLKISRTTRAGDTYLTVILPTATMLRVRGMNAYQQAAFQEEVLRRVEEELDKMLD